MDPYPNVVTIRKANTISTREIDGRTNLVTNYQAKACYIVPAILHTCYISRKIGLDTYSLRFEKHLRHPVYFDFKKDILNVEECDALASFLGTPWFADLKIDLEEANQIRFLSFAEEWYLYQDRILQRLHRFEGLRNIYFERSSGEKASLLSHFEWGLRMKWQTWRTWKTVGPGGSIDVPHIKFLERDHFRKLVKSQPA